MRENNFYLRLKRVIKEKRFFITLYRILKEKTVLKLFKNSETKTKTNYYSIIINDKNLKLLYTNKKTLSRNKTILTKEKQTINWIDSFHPNHILLDIGANIGIFSIYAATKNIKVFSVEPMARNFNILTRNIIINQLYNYLTPLNVGINKFSGFSRFETPINTDGHSGNQINTSENFAENSYLNILVYTLDALVFDILKIVPSHIKIDTDGDELEILKSGREVLKNKNLLSISIEIDESKQNVMSEILDILTRNNYKFVAKESAVSTHTNPILFNYIFNAK